MPDSQVVKASKGLLGCHHEALNAGSVESDPGKCADVRLIIFPSQNKLNCGPEKAKIKY